MLVLTRKPGERLFIEDPATGRSITVQLVKVMHGGGCRIGIDAPLDLIIRREEVPALAVMRPETGDRSETDSVLRTPDSGLQTASA